MADNTRVAAQPEEIRFLARSTLFKELCPMKYIKGFFTVLLVTLAIVGAAAAFQTNVGGYHLSPNNFLVASNTQCLEATVGSGPNVCFVDVGTGLFKVTQGDGATLGNGGTITTNGTAVGAGTCQAQPALTLTGVSTTSAVDWSVPTALPATWQTGIHVMPVVTANTVTLSLCNASAGSITPAAQVVNIRVIL
jgi:hypothetical protein